MPGPRRRRDPKDGRWYVHVTQGETYVTEDPEETLTTILGSCIAACIRDIETGAGGMNHFLLPEGSGQDRSALRYGVNAMELLINGILKRGGSRDRLEAKIFGGANVISALSDIGARNAAFARKFLSEEGIPIVGGDVGGESARRIQFWPSTGRARQVTVTALDRGLIESEIVQSQQQLPASKEADVELF